MKKIIAIAALSAALTTPAFAAGNNAYLFGDLSSANYSNVGGAPNPGKIGIGAGMGFAPNISGEVGLHIFGDSSLAFNTGRVNTLKASSITFAGVGHAPIAPQFSVFGKLGLALNRAEVTNNAGFAPVTTNQTSLYISLGAQFDLNRQFALRAQYENFGNFESGTNPMSASTIGVAGVLYF